MASAADSDASGVTRGADAEDEVVIAAGIAAGVSGLPTLGPKTTAEVFASNIADAVSSFNGVASEMVSTKELVDRVSSGVGKCEGEGATEGIVGCGVARKAAVDSIEPSGALNASVGSASTIDIP